MALGPQPDDELNLVRGVGGIETVYEKHVESIILDAATLKNFKVDVGAIQYGFEIDAIIGMNVLEQAKAAVNFYNMTLTPAVQAS